MGVEMPRHFVTAGGPAFWYMRILMKTPLILIGCAVVVAGVIAWEESRVSTRDREITELRSKLGDDGKGEPAASRRVIRTNEGRLPAKGEGGSAPSADLGSGEGVGGGREPRGRSKGDQVLGETIRKMYENPAGRAILDVENKLRAQSLYGALIDDLDMSREEEEYFLGLLAPGISEEDAVGMKMLGAKSDEEAGRILDGLDATKAKRLEDVRDFLNDDEDFAKYERYQARKAEYEQLPAIRGVMKAAGTPLTADQESSLIDAMFEARNETGLTERWDGRAGFEQFGKPGVSKRFESDWVALQENLDGRLPDVLDGTQTEAFSQHQAQYRDMILMSFRMVETMIEAANEPAGAPAAAPE